MRVVIVGGGISGLVASYVMRKKGIRATVLESKAVGGEFLAGGLKYIHATDAMCELFDQLGLAYSQYTIQGGIMLRGRVHPYPRALQEMTKEEAAIIQADHYRKTRRTEGGPDAKRAMNDPAAVKPRRALRCHFPDLIKELASRANVVKSELVKIKTKNNELLLNHMNCIAYDYLVLTVPLWVIREVAPFRVPQGMAMKLNTVQVAPVKDRFAKWDYVYTPYTPANAIHRFSPNGREYSIEINGMLDRHELESDLNFIFAEGYAIGKVREGLKGHLLPLDSQPDWPENIAPLGRFATWDSRATMDVTLTDAAALVERWFGSGR